MSRAPFAIGKRRRAPWLVFVLCALLVVDVLAWATWRVLALERSERTASAQADIAQRERLALWQMDSFVSGMVARESARPYFEYRARYAADQPYDRAWMMTDASTVAVSALAAGTGDPVVRLHYQVDPDGTVESPQAWQAVPGQVAPDTPAQLRAERWTRELAPALRRHAMTESAVSETASRGEPTLDLLIAGSEVSAKTQADTRGDAGSAGIGSITSDADESPQPAEPEDAVLRQRLFDIARSGQSVFNYAQAGSDPSDQPVIVGLLQPRWINLSGDELQLVFEREVRVGADVYRQGVWIDWPALRAQLLSIALRLIPGASLEPLPGLDGESAAFRGPDAFATLPLRLRVPPATQGGDLWTPARVTLAVSWVTAIVALVATGIVLRAAMALAERRGRFVAAVTHELRSPLTSFRLHADLLERAHEPEQRARHVGVLRSEAVRLGEVIESVLAYSGLRPAEPVAEPVVVGDVLMPMVDVFRATASEAGTAFDLEMDDTAARARVRVRRGTLERILTNLVENAVRYGSQSDTPRVSVRVGADGGKVRIRVRDNGPGVDPRERSLIFKDFYRGSASSQSHQGIGLGLALARRLARAEGGEISLLEQKPPGATFEACFPIDAD